MTNSKQESRNRAYMLVILCFYCFLSQLDAKNYVLSSSFALALVWLAQIIRNEWQEKDSEELPGEYLNN